MIHPAPAHHSKHLPSLQYPFNLSSFSLIQSDNGAANGTTLWTAAQLLSAYLADTLPAVPHDARVPSTQNIRRPRAIELGSGIGLTALVLAALGYDVLATDTSQVVDAVLLPNIQRNANSIDANPQCPSGLPGSVHVRVLDWTVPPAQWSWEDRRMIADSDSSLSQQASLSETPTSTLQPPFDLVLTSDTIYNAALTTPLLRTIHHILTLSSTPTTSTTSKKPRNDRPLVYVALENRDPEQISAFFREAQEVWSMAVKKVPTARVRRAMTRNGLGGWKIEDWEGVEIWQMHMTPKASTINRQAVSQSTVTVNSLEAPSCEE